jgi:N-acetylglutamate synthase-like GNAT family acetyltransferase
MSEMLKRVGAAILEAESKWTPKAGEPKERVMARAALEAMRDWHSLEFRIDAIANTPTGSGYGRRFLNAAIDGALRD